MFQLTSPKETVKWWHATLKLPQEEKEKEFERALQQFYAENCTPEEVDWWERMRCSGGDPLLHKMPPRGGASSSTA